MTASVLTAEERQEVLLKELQNRSSMTVVEAWEFGHGSGLYRGGDGPIAKDDLMALCKQRKARRTDGFWRHINEPNRIRNRYPRWADHWTAL